MTIATVRSHTRIPWVFGRNRRTLHFEVIGTDGASRFRIARYGGLRPHRIQVDDIEGRKLGQLRQMSSSWKQFRTGRITFAVESHQNHLATADIRIVPSDNRYADVREPIYDTAGVVIATVQRQGRYTGALTDSFGYRLDCPEQCADPLPALLFACLFAYYLYDLLALGGLLGIGRTRPSWEMMGYEAKMPPA